MVSQLKNEIIEENGDMAKWRHGDLGVENSNWDYTRLRLDRLTAFNAKAFHSAWIKE